MGSETLLFIGGHYEIKNPGAGQQVTKYYFAGASRVAMRKYTIPVSMAVEYFLGDHLGSTSITTDTSGAKVSEMRYKAWGEVRYSWISGVSTTPTYTLPDYTFTGQYSNVDDFGLMFYNARWYDPYITQFSQPDSIVPNPYNSQAWDRYAYALNNPLKYTDPTGHDVDCGIGDSYCNDARREYHYSWRPSHNTSFQTFMRARDAYGFYYNHPDIALEDQYLGNDQEVSSWEDVDPYTLGSVYSEDVRHEMFTPVSDQFLVWEMDRLNALRDAGESVDPKQWAAVAAALYITFGPDGGGGGGGGGDVKLSGNYLRKLEKQILADGYQSIEDLKIPGEKGAGRYDLYVKPDGDIVVKPSSGIGPGEPTGYNIYDLDP